ncbi:phage major capsid protein [Salipiger abyssi]|uniref:Phage major capsid protein, HK97 family n=1 Tax=Salipiger abyssi TaxID=1250539 RepID=A0A1P8UUR5_9RHOB|nr:phage major capsid protein [Salipiger abyssi]APZ53129.1 phage major capsid protein, HK97 family [Salipiger abyssi]
MATYAEQIAAFEAKRASNVAAMKSLMDEASEKGETLDAEAQDQFDELQAENESVDKHLTRLKSMQSLDAQTAKPVSGDTEKSASESRTPTVHAKAKPPKAAPGVAFARVAKVKALSRLDGETPREVAKALYGEDSEVFGHFVKAAVGAANAGSAPWAGNLITDGGAFADFVEFLRPMTILGKFGTGNIPGLRRIPFDVPILVQETGGTGYWVGEGKAKPLTSWTTSRTKLEPLKVATIAAVTEEMLRRSSVDADMWIRDELASAVSARIDTTFIDPAAAAVAGVAPASLTNGVTPILSSGNDADAVRTDMRALAAGFRAVNNTTAGAVWIMPETTAEALSMMMNPLGQPEFSGITAEGGTFLGKPVITSEYVPSDYEADSGGNPGVTGAVVALVKASDVFFADEGGVAVDFSREASLEMADNPTTASDTPTGGSMVSMFQTNSVAFRAERALNWAKRRAASVQVLGNVNWGD